jgi:carbamoyltransferase
MHILNLLHEKVPTTRISMAGGCALNSVANGKMLIDTPFRETCIQPAAGDDGLALGAALYVSNSILKEGKRWVMKNSYLGDEYSDSVIKAELERYKIPYEELSRETLIDRTTEEIKNGNVVGWFQGRMEWGPRALGNRSILAHPGFPNMKDILNARIKHREWFRPFAPSVLQERQTDIFEQDYPSPFMLHVYKIRPEWRERLSAVNHVDDTGRLQTVTREENPLYYDLIKNFDGKTGIPIVLNTSFNENEPIVCEPFQAIECFMRTKMDVLVIGSFFCKKAESI